MSLKHIIKHTETDIVFKCYITDSNGGIVNDMTNPLKNNWMVKF